MSERKGDWMCTRTGIEFWPLDPRAEEVWIEDIAHALSNLCRYNGQCRTFYSVAQHCVLVKRQVEKMSGTLDAVRQGLLHDATEAYLGDMIRPLKGCFPEYRVAEHKVFVAIMRRFGIKESMYAVVKRADEILLATEAGQLMPAASVARWTLPGRPDPKLKIRPLLPAAAKRAFLTEYRRLFAGGIR